MARIMAFDYGQKRTGIAVTDPLQIIPNALATVETPKLLEFVQNYCKEEEVEAFVVGEPKHKDGNDTYLTPIVRTFADKLRELYPEATVTLWDEQFTSVLAKSAILAAGYKKKQRQDKGMVDRVSATIILGDYMENK